jgi:hypothetical protein
VPGNGTGRVPQPGPTPPSPTPPPSRISASVRDQRDAAERLLELAGEWAKGVLADVTVLAEKAAARAREIPDQPQLAREVAALRVMVAELVVRVSVLELDLEERDRERQRRRRKAGAA